MDEGPAKTAEHLDEKVFELIDTNKDGTLTVDELRAALLHMGEVRVQWGVRSACPPTSRSHKDTNKRKQALSLDDVSAIVRDADENGDGVIDLEEFIQMMRRQTKYLDYVV